jgi:hypothetical protein
VCPWSRCSPTAFWIAFQKAEPEGHRVAARWLPGDLALPAGTYLDELMGAVARLAAVSLDTSDPAGLATFYRRLLDLEVFFESDDFVALKGAGILITTQRVEDHRTPSWPGGPAPKQLHLEFAVSDLEKAEAQALAIGATKPDTQPNPDHWRVLLDPAGHPFCITTLIPEV